MVKSAVTVTGIATVIAILPFASAPAQTADKGHDLFMRRCAACHSVATANTFGIAPSLKAVVGRKAASVPGFGYSEALRASGVTWTPEALDRFLKSPSKMVPRTNMAISVTDPEDRAEIIQFLKRVEK